MPYHAFQSAEGPIGSFEVFNDEGGWYWQACYPGCLPDGDPAGPFETEQDAIDDANEGF